MKGSPEHCLLRKNDRIELRWWKYLMKTQWLSSMLRRLPGNVSSFQVADLSALMKANVVYSFFTILLLLHFLACLWRKVSGCDDAPHNEFLIASSLVKFKELKTLILSIPCEVKRPLELFIPSIHSLHTDRQRRAVLKSRCLRTVSRTSPNLVAKIHSPLLSLFSWFSSSDSFIDTWQTSGFSFPIDAAIACLEKKEQINIENSVIKYKYHINKEIIWLLEQSKHYTTANHKHIILVEYHNLTLFLQSKLPLSLHSGRRRLILTYAKGT